MTWSELRNTLRKLLGNEVSMVPLPDHNYWIMSFSKPLKLSVEESVDAAFERRTA